MRIEAKTYKTSNGDMLTARVVIVTALMKAVSEKIRYNSNETEWRLCTVELEHPDGSKQTKQAQLFESSYDLYPDSYLPGEEVELIIQTEGEGKGYAKIQLPAIERIDVDAFLQAAEFQEEEQLVDEELVA